MSSNDDLKRRIDAAIKNDRIAGVDSTTTLADDNLETIENNGFTFFHKQHSDDVRSKTAPIIFATAKDITALKLRFDKIETANAKTKLHIAELMDLMSEIADGLTLSTTLPRKRASRHLQWMFYGCLTLLGLGWFLLSPSGHILLIKTLDFLVK